MAFQDDEFVEEILGGERDQGGHVAVIVRTAEDDFAGLWEAGIHFESLCSSRDAS